MINFENYTVKDLNTHSKSVVDLQWNNEGNYLGTVSHDKTVKIGQLDTSGSTKTIHAIPHNHTDISLIGWNPNDSSKFALAGEDKSIELWDVRASRVANKIPSRGGNISLVWSPNSNYIAVGNKDNHITVYDVKAGKQIAKTKFFYEVNEIRWTVNSDYLLSATAGGDMGCIDLIHFQDESNLTVIDSISAHTSICYQLQIDSTNRRMAVGGMDNLISLWDLNDLVCHQAIYMENEVKGIAYSGDGSILGTISDDHNLYFFNSDTAESLSKISFEKNMSSSAKLYALVWNPKLNIIALSCEDKSSSPQYLKLLSF